MTKYGHVPRVNRLGASGPKNDVDEVSSRRAGEPEGRSAAPQWRRGSLRRNFTWSVLGTTVYYLTQWLLVVFLARNASASEVGIFVFAQALSAPVYLCVGLNLRVVRATDVRGRWTAQVYSRVRAALNAISVLISLILGLAVGVQGSALAVLVAVCVGKASEATSQSLYGYFQLHDELAYVSRSLLLRAAIGSSGFVVGLIAFDTVVAASVGLAIGWSLVFVFHDRPLERRLLRDAGAATGGGSWFELVRTAAPLGASAGVGSLATNVPRYVVQWMLGSAALGSYAAIAYLGQVVAMITGALADTVIGRLARLASQGAYRAYVRLLTILTLFGLAVAVGSALTAWLFGEWLVQSLLGTEYVNQPVLITVMATGGLVTVQRCLGRGLQALQLFRELLYVGLLTLAAAVVAALIAIPRFGLVGAAATLGIAFSAGSVAAGIVLVRRSARIIAANAAKGRDQ